MVSMETSNRGRGTKTEVPRRLAAKSDTPRGAGGLMSWAASKAVGSMGLGVALARLIA